jgi:hypothetical protein
MSDFNLCPRHGFSERLPYPVDACPPLKPRRDHTLSVRPPLTESKFRRPSHYGMRDSVAHAEMRSPVPPGMDFPQCAAGHGGIDDTGRAFQCCLRAENLFLRKQLALYRERQIKPRRASRRRSWRVAGITPYHSGDVLTAFLENSGTKIGWLATRPDSVPGASTYSGRQSSSIASLIHATGRPRSHVWQDLLRKRAAAGCSDRTEIVLLAGCEANSRSMPQLSEIFEHQAHVQE